MTLNVVKNATCTFCGCVCDDIELHADGERIVKAKNACSLGDAWFKHHTAERAYPDALIDGAAGTAQYSDTKATDPAVAALRRKVKPVADETLRNDEAHAVIVAGGKRHEVHIAHASGTAENPMGDAQIEAKFLANAAPVIGASNAQRAVEWIASLEKQADVRELIALLA